MGGAGEEAGIKAGAGGGTPRTAWDEGFLIPAERGRELAWASRRAIDTYEDAVLPAFQKLGKAPGNYACIQAGGGVGILPLRLARDFQVVYTFEPDALNFYCLNTNCRVQENLYAFRAALWGEPAGLIMNPGSNAGAGWCVPGGLIPGVTLAALPPFNFYGLVWLDIEGAEDVVLDSYWLKKARPLVLVVERKGLEKRYVPDSSLLATLANDYITEGKVGNDVILVRR